ncbi:ribose 5-phosphate isomerase A [Terrisporobacter glycolicus]|uniref:Ribose 5-phosphate isomerase A n=1 Tax=Terrisporobacter glycolicus ATCC 14880 = DSM 1288 TaxID=1121315 RepID=A0ABZ2ET40_9FIRM|nr:ribose 5-phosphate isomerase A [Terrisporobacter glycolicus]
MKKTCAKEALKYIRNKSIIGLGGGSTISHLVSYIKENKLDVKIVTPSFNTEKLCRENNLNVLEISYVSEVSVAFDGCDEIDYDLNALKSCGGIHTKEKIVATMAKDYILLVDESKVCETLKFNYPVVLEIIPESKSIVEKSVKQLGGKVRMRNDKLMEVYFDRKDIKSIKKLDEDLRKIVGVIETSLFHDIATKAIVVGENRIKLIECEKGD